MTEYILNKNILKDLDKLICPCEYCQERYDKFKQRIGAKRGNK